MSRRRVRVSKLLSRILRHRPADFGVELDARGWVDVEALLAALAARGQPVALDELVEVVRTSDKARFALRDEAGRLQIRAQQGHSVPVELDYQAVPPPDVLYHGTVARFLPSIRARGLVRGDRHHVHLSATVAAARGVGARRGLPVILEVRAAAMAAAGHLFYRTPNGVWLTDHVPAGFLHVLE